MKKLLFVCLGNICRSPAAEGIMQHKLNEAGLEGQVYCDSAGTSGHHEGQAADSRMRERATARGYQLLSKSRPVKRSDFVEFDLVLAMDHSNLKNLLELCPKEELRKKIVLICDFCKNFDLEEVPDPYYGGLSGFDNVLDLLEDATEGLLLKISSEL
jgi:protein-tyrosine phosphatase